MAPSAVAIVGMACQYPDADSPVALWENVLTQRRAFREIPPERLNLADYWSPDGSMPDRLYLRHAAVLEGYTFDRVRFRISGSTFRAVDPVHWLALDVAAQALADAGFTEGTELSREMTGVVLGNTLTGEVSRANVMRLRWPYVRRVLDAALVEEEWTPGRRRVFLEGVEAQYKASFPSVGTETLAGGLSNTIAGRICNYFDLKGGGYTVDAACASSLLAVIQACRAVAQGEMEVALAGGVDLSLDPFELIGFARVGALAEGQMRVYDAESNGFWPGEGCGFVVLMPYEKALREGRTIYSVIRGWGISTDGQGGITRPEVEGQKLAVRRAWRRAERGIETAGYFEGHGTGTSVGDTTELRVLTKVRRAADPETPPAAIGSIKANIGHTKAAAGLAGLLKATLAIRHQVLPPTTGCETPHPMLTENKPALRVLKEGEPWPAQQALRAGVSAMGFGGINTHVVVEHPPIERQEAIRPKARRLLASAQDAELLVMGASNPSALLDQVERVADLTAKASQAELSDLAAQLAQTVDDCPTVRSAVVASMPAEATERLQTLALWLEQSHAERFASGIYLGTGSGTPRIGFLFPGQGAPSHLDGGMLRRRFAAARALYGRAQLPQHADGQATEVAQPAIVTASMAMLHVLDRLGVSADVAVGHSLGELTALRWAGALNDDELLRLATVRGEAMASLSTPTGTMAGLGAGTDTVEKLIDKKPVVIAGLNGPRQTIVSGPEEAVAAVLDRANEEGIAARQLRVSHAFHSPLVAAAAEPLAAYLAEHPLAPVEQTVVSTITGAPIRPTDDVHALLDRQVTGPVRFMEAVEIASQSVDLWIEVGPGSMLGSLAGRFIEEPIFSTEAGAETLRPLLRAVGAAFARGATVEATALFKDRFTRPFALDKQFQFLANPCEQAPPSDADVGLIRCETRSSNGTESDSEVSDVPEEQPESTVELVRQLVAERAELPPEAIQDKDRLLGDLHLNSITVGELIGKAARRLQLSPSTVPTQYSDVTIAEVARALDERAYVETAEPMSPNQAFPAGLELWIRPFTVEDVEQALPRLQSGERGEGSWTIVANPNDPLEEALRSTFEHIEGRGVVVCLPPENELQHLNLLLAGTADIINGEGERSFVLIQRDQGSAGWARTLYREVPDVTVTVVDIPVNHPEAVSWIDAEVRVARGYTEARYDETGVRRVPRLRVLPLDDEAEEWPLGLDDVVLATGGGKGITAECVQALGMETGAQLVLLGRSQPDEDTELAATLERMNDAGLRVHYVAADVTDAPAVRKTIATVEAQFGPITGVIHGAARNVPCPLQALDEDTIRNTLGPKVQGLRHVLEAVDPERLQLLVTFGSIIARMGLPGEADYALANAWLTRETERWKQAHSHCRCLAIEWSIWSEVGMGARLGSLDALVQRGITPIAPTDGVSLFRRLLVQPPEKTAVVVAGRFGDPSTLKLDRPELPLLRFLERPRLYYPGIELIAEAELSTASDPYLNDHVLQGDRVLPAVLGLEAMAQVATALAEVQHAPQFEEVTFRRSVVVPEDESTMLRVVAHVVDQQTIDVALRCEKTSFQTDHFRATCRFDGFEEEPETLLQSIEETESVSLDPDRDLYGHLLFHRGRFQRIEGYWTLRADACIAEIGSRDEDVLWFGSYHPQNLVLGDPGSRDAAIHAIQACIPHATLIPIGAERIHIAEPSRNGACFVHARERSQEGDVFVYDVSVTDGNGGIFEQWHGLQLRKVGTPEIEGWAAPLLGPYVTRRVQEIVPGADVSAVLMQDAAAERRERSDCAIQQALGTATRVQRRINGKPKVAGGRTVSAAHAGDLTLAIAGSGSLGCDLERVVPRSEDEWSDLLGAASSDLARLVATETGEDFDTAATRIWTARECLKKAGFVPTAPLTFQQYAGNGGAVLGERGYSVASLIVAIGEGAKLVVAVLATPASAESGESRIPNHQPETSHAR